MAPNALSGLGRRTQEPPISWLMKMTLDHPKLISLAARLGEVFQKMC